ncbi:HPF/RaiA family ribosome-associated protein [Dactylosporangium aurantiacum]|uniref:HPF/RaiA family ribosome-associated protein n=1 Tax=Dactylosporangium aurantiacum TaxID=35754 RepID=A0A9Q9IEA4_9ACTN|nr:HPF/RaiA family ribosome-associated protein [Dactylosporangium aurantiacum]MDG6106818.1 HPF/RaiA family ribosome-associated protein [Dactylosporangium aurantiacum]UWZ50955.1 HPF/RaiA family ribosome-associated protein [Dactylosporangium aurantiacum]
MSRTHDEVAIQVQLQPGMEQQLQGYAREKITTVLGHTGRPVLYARVRLARTGNPAATRPVTARADIDVNGRVLHAEVSADTAYEAVDLLQDRLQGQLERDKSGHR